MYTYTLYTLYTYIYIYSVLFLTWHPAQSAPRILRRGGPKRLTVEGPPRNICLIST